MKVLVLGTWESLKSDEGRKAFRERPDKQYYNERIEKHKVKTSEWTKGTGIMYYMMEFESYDAYAKFMDDEKLQRYFANVGRLVKNFDVNVLREAI